MAETTMDELVLWTNWYYGRNNYGRNGTMAETTMDEMVLWSKRLWTKQLRTNWYHGRNGTMDETTMDETTMDEMVLWTNWYYGRNDYGRYWGNCSPSLLQISFHNYYIIKYQYSSLPPKESCMNEL